VATIGLSGCGASAASFTPDGPCVADGQVAGAYPDLEARIPSTFDGTAPARLDSGRNCTPERLGTLARAGIAEVRFAGGLWETGERSGVTLAVFSAPGLTGQQLIDFYAAGARAGRHTENVMVSVNTFDGDYLWELETLNGESFQSILVAAGPEPGLVLAVLVGSDVRENSDRTRHEELLAQARDAFLGR